MSASADVRPFPFAALDAVSRAEVDAGARLRAALRTRARLDALAAAAAELAKGPIEVLLRKIRRTDAARAPAGALGVLVDLSGDGERGATALVEVEGAFAAAFVARVLDRPPPRLVDPSRTAPPPLAGAFAAALALCLRRAHAGAPLRVLAAGPGAELARGLTAHHPHATTAWLTVLFGEEAFDARVSVPDDAVATSAPPAFDAGALARLGDARLSAPLVVATCLARRDEIAALDRGDVFLAPGLSLSAVAIVPERGERGLAADLAEDGQLVVRGHVEDHPWDAGSAKETAAMADGELTPEVMKDATVVVRVELGAVTMTAREWSALGPGDVVSLGRRLGEPAVLRVGGAEVARGELVQIDGEYGVRIVDRPGAR